MTVMEIIESIIPPTAIMFSASVFGILTGLQESNKDDTNKQSFNYGYVMQSVLIVLCIILWVMYLSNLKGSLSNSKAIILALSVAFVSIGWGGMLGYRSGMTNPTDATINTALAFIPLGTIILAFYTHHYATTLNVSAGVSISIFVLIGLLYAVSGIILLAKKDMKSGVDEKWYDAFTGIMIGGGIVIALVALLFMRKSASKTPSSLRPYPDL